MEDKKHIKLSFDSPSNNGHPILGKPVHVDGSAYVVKNRAVVGKVYRVICPKCQKPLLIKASSAKKYKATCKTCGISIYYMGKELTSRQADNQQTEQQEKNTEDTGASLVTKKYFAKEPVAKDNVAEKQEGEVNETLKYGRPDARLEWGGFFSKKYYNIQRPGEHYIGRDDDEIRSDVSIKDEYVSRRSVLIEAIPKGRNECLYKLTVKSATNPVLVNGQAKEVGESIYLNYGDTILVGNTTLIFKRGRK